MVMGGRAFSNVLAMASSSALGVVCGYPLSGPYSICMTVGGFSFTFFLSCLLFAFAIAVVVFFAPLCACVPRVVGVWAFADSSRCPLTLALSHGYEDGVDLVIALFRLCLVLLYDFLDAA